jgi:large subunit ribosomal protein L4
MSSSAMPTVRFVNSFAVPIEPVVIDNTYMPAPGKVFLPYAEPAIEAPLFSLAGGMEDAVGSIELNPEVWNQPMRKDLLHRVVVWQTARRREKNNEGTVFVQRRADVKGSGKKIYKQKGTGQARHGDRQANLFRGGGKAHGPQQRKLAFKLPRQVRKLALKVALSAKLAEGNVFVVEDIDVDTHKTQNLIKLLRGFNLHRPLIVHAEEELGNNTILAGRNLSWLDFIPQDGVNVFDLLRHHEVIVTRKAVEEIEERLTRSVRAPRFVAPTLAELIESGAIQQTHTPTTISE